MGKGSIKILAVVALIALVAGSWYTVFNNASAKEKEYKEYVTVARDKKEKELYDEV